jgi:hypothetical protein
MKHTRRLLIAAAVVGATGLATAGWAYWSAGGSGSASASVGTLNPPAGVSATATLGSGTVPVSWTASSTTTPSGVTPTGYYVQRLAGTTPVAACGSSASSLVADTSCDDLDVPDGTYTYIVTAAFRSWTAQSDASAEVTVVTDATPPVVSSITRVADAANPTNAGEVSWTVTFSESVAAVDVTDFTVAENGSVASAAVSSVSGSGTTWTVSASTGAGDGTLGVNLVDNDTIVDGVGNRLGGAGAGNGNFTGQSYSIDKSAPYVISIVRAGSNPTNAASVSWTVTFNQSVNGADIGDFALVGSGASLSSITAASGENFTVTAATGSDGILGLNLVDNNSITDAAGNPLGTSGGGLNGDFAGEAYTVDKTAPTVTINQAASQADPTNSQPINFSLVFSEPVSGLTASDVTLTGTAGNVGGATSTVTGGPTSYNLTVSGLTADGTVTASVPADGAADSAGNGNAVSTTTDATVTYDTTGPAITGVSSTLANGSYTAGQVVPVTVTFGEPVTVSGTPQLTLSTGTPASTPANYAAGSGTATLTFTYTVAVGNTSADLDYAASSALALNGGGITDAAGNDAALTLASPGAAGSLAANKALVIDTAAPSAASMSITCNFGSGANYSCSGTYATATGDLPSSLRVTIYRASDNTEVAAAAAPTTTSGGNWSNLNGNGLARGTYYARLSQSDVAGNTTTVTSANFTR